MCPPLVARGVRPSGGARSRWENPARAIPPRINSTNQLNGSNKSENQKEKPNSTLNSQPHPRVFCNKERLDDHPAQDDRRVFLATKTLTREKITERSRVQFPVGTKFGDDHLVYVASGITSSQPT